MVWTVNTRHKTSKNVTKKSNMSDISGEKYGLPQHSTAGCWMLTPLTLSNGGGGGRPFLKLTDVSEGHVKKRKAVDRNGATQQTWWIQSN